MSITERGLTALRRFLCNLTRRLGRPAKQTLLVALDAGLSAVTAGVVVWAATGSVALSEPATGALLVVAAGLGAAASTLGGLHRLKLDAFAPRGLARFATATGAAAAVLPVAADLPVPGERATAVLALFALGFFTVAIGLRIVLRAILLWAMRGPDRRPVLIWGAGDAGVRLAAALRDDPAVTPAAFLDEDADLHGLVLGGLPVHPCARAADLARRIGAERVLIALPNASVCRQAEIAADLAAQGLQPMTVPSFAEIAGETPTPAGLLTTPAARFLGRAPVCPDLAAARPAYAGRTILVTGAGGSVGSELCRQLLPLGPHRLVLLDNSETALYTLGEELDAEAAAQQVALCPVIGSVTDRAAVLRLMQAEGVEVVLHAAACKHVPLVEANPLAGLATNVLGTRAVAEAARRIGAERFVLVSTDKAVRPAGVMGLSKRLAECVMQDLARPPSATAMAAVRFGNVLGSSGSVIPRFRDQIARGGPVTLTHEEATRYFMTLTEAARLVLLSGAMAVPGRAETYVLDMGAPVRIRALAERMIAAAGLTVQGPGNPKGDIAIQTTGLRPGEKLHEELLIDGDMTATTHPKVMRLCEHAGRPRALAETLLALRAAIGAGDIGAALAAAHACLAPESGQENPVTAAAGLGHDDTPAAARLHA